MTLSSLITVLLHSLRPILSAVISLVLTLSSCFTGPMGDYLALSAKTVKLGPSETNISYEISLNVKEADRLLASYEGEESSISLEELICEISEAYGFLELDESGIASLSDSFNIYSDPDNLRVVMESCEDDSLKIYADTSAIALSPELTEKILGYMSEEELSAYKKYMSGKSFYFSISELMGEEAEALSLLEQESTATIISDVTRAFANAMTSEGFVKAYTDTIKPIYDKSSEYFTEVDVDGATGYRYYIRAIEYLNLCTDTYNKVATENFADSYVNLVKILISSISDTSLSSLFDLPAELPEDEAAALRGEFLSTAAEGKATLESLMALLNEERENEQSEFSELIPYLEHSYNVNTIYEKDGKIHYIYNVVISNGAVDLADIKVTTVYSDFGGAVISPALAVPFENRMSYELLDNKVGYEMALEKGVSGIEIYWEAEMTPDAPLRTSSEGFYVNYKTTYSELFDKDDTLSEEEKQYLRELYEGEYEYAYKDSSAHVIDGSVYLPLRQLMENAGYEVSWDSVLRKAYVTVGDEKIEMTGTIINDKTYVKVRDFEKLGATVGYEEEIIYADAWNDFYKACYATITFAK